MAKYIRNVDAVEAVEWDGDADLANSFLRDSYGWDWQYSGLGPDITVALGYSRMFVLVGTYIVKTAHGMVYSVDAVTFKRCFTRMDAPLDHDIELGRPYMRMGVDPARGSPVTEVIIDDVPPQWKEGDPAPPDATHLFDGSSTDQ